MHLLEEITKNCSNTIIITGDFNSHNPLWGSAKCDSNGRIIEGFMEKHDLVIMNDGTPTRMDPHSGGLSCLDLTIVSKEIASKLDWTVLGNFGSDHNAIKCSL